MSKKMRHLVAAAMVRNPANKAMRVLGNLRHYIIYTDGVTKIEMNKTTFDKLKETVGSIYNVLPDWTPTDAIGILDETPIFENPTVPDGEALIITS